MFWHNLSRSSFYKEFRKYTKALYRNLQDLMAILLSLQKIINKIKKQIPFNEKNKKKALHTLKGGIFFSTRRNIQKMNKLLFEANNNIQVIERSLGKIPHSRFTKFHDRWGSNFSELKTYNAAITVMLAHGNEGRIYDSLINSKFNAINAKDIENLQKEIISFYNVINNSTIELIMLMRGFENGSRSLDK